MRVAVLLLPIAALAAYVISRRARPWATPAGEFAPDEPESFYDALGADAWPSVSAFVESVGSAVKETGAAIARGLRNNNPGNIRKNSAFNWQGQTGDDGAFAIFATPAAGIRAIGVLLKKYQDKYGLDTIDGIIKRWAPASENNTRAYINAVARAVGVAPTQRINMHDPATLAAVTAAIIKHENGSQPYDAATIAANVNA